MEEGAVRRRFSLILEAYCRTCGTYLKSLIKQVEALDKLTTVTDSLKQEKDVSFYLSQVNMRIKSK